MYTFHFPFFFFEVGFDASVPASRFINQVIFVVVLLFYSIGWEDSKCASEGVSNLWLKFGSRFQSFGKLLMRIAWVFSTLRI